MSPARVTGSAGASGTSSSASSVAGSPAVRLGLGEQRAQFVLIEAEHLQAKFGILEFPQFPAERIFVSHPPFSLSRLSAIMYARLCVSLR